MAPAFLNATAFQSRTQLSQHESLDVELWNIQAMKISFLRILWLNFYGLLCLITHAHSYYRLCWLATYLMSVTTSSSEANKLNFLNPENPFKLKAQLLFFNIKVPLIICWRTCCLKIHTQQMTGFILVKHRKCRLLLCVHQIDVDIFYLLCMLLKW